MRAAAQIDPSPSPAALAKSRLKRLFERQVLRVSPAERLPLPSVPAAGGEKDDLEPSSVCLDGMVRNFLEDGGERAAAAAPRCINCFNGGEASDDDDDTAEASAMLDAAETIKVVS